jgi:hypothetical protein
MVPVLAFGVGGISIPMAVMSLARPTPQTKLKPPAITPKTKVSSRITKRMAERLLADGHHRAETRGWRSIRDMLTLFPALKKKTTHRR